MRHFLSVLVLLCSVGATSQTTKEHKQKPKPTEPLACHAETNVQKIFWGFWNPKPSNTPVTVTIEFEQPKDGIDCVGEPLELTVPNLQVVQLFMKGAGDACSSTAVTMSITKATGDNPVPDILQLISKVGAVPFVKEAPYYSIPPQKNRVVSIDATCNVGTGRKSTQSVKLTYQNPPRVAVSSGIVFAHGVDSYGFKTTQTGSGSGGVVNFQNSIAITGSPSAQVIPFGLANIYYAGSRTLNFNAQLGVGVNPNLSTAKVEYFASPFALGWHDVYISPGVHIGEHENLTGGFALGQLTPSNLSKVPIGWQRYTGFGISLSYNLKPLVKSSSSNSGASKKQ